MCMRVREHDTHTHTSYGTELNASSGSTPSRGGTSAVKCAAAKEKSVSMRTCEHSRKNVLCVRESVCVCVCLCVCVCACVRACVRVLCLCTHV